jgi:hypothetical protein
MPKETSATETITVEKPLENPPRKSKTLLYILLLLFAVIIAIGLGLAGFYGYTIYRSNMSGEQEENDEPDESEDEDEVIDEEGSEVKTKEVEGDFLTVTLPEDWTFVEYEDGVNDKYLTSGVVYKGLTGFAILDETDTELYRTDAVYGVGSMDVCETYYKFADFDQAHLDDKKADLEELEGTMQIKDMSYASYNEYNILEVRIRRIAADVYWDENDANAKFDAACGGISRYTLPYSTIAYTTDGKTENNYWTKLPLGTTNSATLMLLDNALKSLDIK